MEDITTKKLCLGTAQFGLDYGVSNTRGTISKDEVFEILQYAQNKGVRELDTAYSYGSTEKTIGEFIQTTKSDLLIISKVPQLNKKNGDRSVKEYCCETLERLHQSRLFGYLVHSFNDIITHKWLWPEMESLKKAGHALKIGVSIYMPEQLESLLSNNIHFDILQVPYNLFDQRFNGYFPRIKRMNIEIYARSVFLQGLFFLNMTRIENDFLPAKNMINKLNTISLDYKIPINALCLCFVLLNPFIDRVILGVDSLEHFKEDMASLEYIDKIKNIYKPLESLRLDNEEIIIPTRWKERQKQLSR